MNLLILGPQGSGKGTQAKLLAEKLDLFYVEAGNILRKLALENPVVDRIINKEGKLLPDEETFSYLKGEIKKNAPDLNNLIFDGFPRSPKQYELLKDWFHQEGIRLDLAIFLEISEAETIRRLSARRTCEKCGEVYNSIQENPEHKLGDELNAVVSSSFGGKSRSLERGGCHNLITNPPPKTGCSCGGQLVQRADDTPVAIKTRLEVYRKMTQPLIRELQKEGILIKLNGERPIKTIFRDILLNIEKING